MASCLQLQGRIRLQSPAAAARLRKPSKHPTASVLRSNFCPSLLIQCACHPIYSIFKEAYKFPCCIWGWLTEEKTKSRLREEHPSLLPGWWGIEKLGCLSVGTSGGRKRLTVLPSFTGFLLIEQLLYAKLGSRHSENMLLPFLPSKTSHNGHNGPPRTQNIGSYDRGISQAGWGPGEREN